MRSMRLSRWRRFTVIVGVLGLLAIAIVAILASPAKPASANPATGIVSMTSGEEHTCALTSAGGVRCWGSGSVGQLGNGTTTNTTVPTGVVGLAEVIDVVAGGRHTCALTGVGGVKCWGFNFFGSLGNGSTTDSALPSDVSGLTSGVSAIGSGNYQTCAVTATGVLCWGDVYGLTAAAVPGTSDITKIVGGRRHFCGITMTGEVKCWGDNSTGQLGNGTTTSSATPVVVTGLSGVVALAQGSPGATDFTCALRGAGDVKCWGLNRFGQLGAPSGEVCGSLACSTTPIAVLGLEPGVLAISAGYLNACAATATTVECWGSAFGSTATSVPGFTSGILGITRGTDHGCVWLSSSGAECWGSNSDGQLGDGTGLSRLSPATVVELVAKPTPTNTPCPPSGCPTPEPIPTCDAETCMALSAKNASPGKVICRSDWTAKCAVNVGEDFTLQVVASKPPVAGYELVQSFIHYGSDLIYHPAPVPADEVVWPDSGFSTRWQLPDYVGNGALTGLSSPIPISNFAGTVFELAFECSETPSSTIVDLLPYGHPVASTSGALYSAPGSPPLFTSEFVIPEVGSLIVNCVPPPAPVGGIAVDPDLRPLPLETPASSGPSAGGLGGIASAVAVGAAMLGSAGWYARRRWLRWSEATD